MENNVTTVNQFLNAVEAQELGDTEKAISIWESLAVEGDIQSQKKLAVIYRDGDGVEKDVGGGFYWHFLSTKSDVPEFQAWLGGMYYAGIGIAQDYEAAVKCYEAAANHGCSFSAYKLSKMHCNGEGVAQSYKEAVRWCKVAALQRRPEALYQLGRYYLLGQGAPQDWNAARKWLIKAADLGEMGAASDLGHIYFEGVGAPSDCVAAYSWYLVAKALVSDELNSMKRVIEDDENFGASETFTEQRNGLQTYFNEVEERLVEAGQHLTPSQIRKATEQASKQAKFKAGKALKDAVNS